jgi:hypothetical protein
MTASNIPTQTEQSIPVTVNFSHRLSNKKADMANIIDLVDTVDCMSIRAISVLGVMADHLLDSRSVGSTINKDALYWALQSAIKEIEDLNAVVNAYCENTKA